MCLVVSGENFVKMVFVLSWVVHHDSIAETDVPVCKAASVLRSLLQTLLYELCVLVQTSSMYKTHVYVQ